MDINNLLEDLSYQLSSPEAEELHVLIINDEIEKAQKLLTQYCSLEQSCVVIDYFKKINNQKISLLEISINDINYNNLEQNYLFKVGNNIEQSKIIKVKKDFYFYNDKKIYLVQKAKQIWQINNI